MCMDEGIDELAEFCGAGEAVAEWTARLDSLVFCRKVGWPDTLEGTCLIIPCLLLLEQWVALFLLRRPWLPDYLSLSLPYPNSAASWKRGLQGRKTLSNSLDFFGPFVLLELFGFW